MEKSFVGDPILWPGLIYSPLNNAGLLFALGTIAGDTGLLFEEFSENCQTAICRRKSGSGWQRLKVALAVRSSSHNPVSEDIDLLICWIDDAPQATGPPHLVLPRALGSSNAGGRPNGATPRGLESILPEGAADDLLERGHSRESYEETVRLLDEQIKKLRTG